MLRDALLKAVEREIAPVDTPVGRVYVRALTAGEKDDFDAECAIDGKCRSRMILRTCCDENGNLEFGERDLPAVDELPLNLLEPIFDAALQVNRLSQRAQRDVRKNSSGRDENSSSG